MSPCLNLYSVSSSVAKISPPPTDRPNETEARPLMSRPSPNSFPAKTNQMFFSRFGAVTDATVEVFFLFFAGSAFPLCSPLSLPRRSSMLAWHLPPSRPPAPPLSSSPPWSRFLLYLIAQQISGMRRPAACRTLLNVMAKIYHMKLSKIMTQYSRNLAFVEPNAGNFSQGN